MNKHGWKFLTPYNTTTYKDNEFIYPVPGPGEKWGPWFSHPTPTEPDGDDCGPGRLHVMKEFSVTYAPQNWWPWFAEYKEEDIIGESNEKCGVKTLRLRRITKKVFHKIIRLSWCKEQNLQGANLWEANLQGANLREAALQGANLWGANLWGANLQGANLQGANLREANLREANLWGANLWEADLREANLWGANLREADLWGANLWEADLREANLWEANLREADLQGVINYKSAYMNESMQKLFMEQNKEN